MNIKTVSEFYQDTIDFDWYFSIVNSIGKDLNDRKKRFFKSDIFEKSIQKCSGNQILFIDEPGRDHYVPNLGIFEEQKHDDHAIFTPTGKRTKTVPLRLVNTMNRRAVKLPSNYAEWLLVTDKRSAALFETKKIKKFLVFQNDAIVAKIPGEYATIIAQTKKTDFEEREIWPIISDAIDSYIESCRPN